MMLYLRSFTFPSQERESFNFHGARRQCYNTVYPFGVLCRFDPTLLTMDAVTILYGGNGTGKTTALNVMAAKLGLLRDTPGSKSTMLNVMADKLALTRDARYNRSTFFEEYVALCDAEVQGNLPPESRIITSDDVFDYMLNLRALNEGIDAQREDMFRQYAADRQVTQAFRTMADYDQLKRVNLARRSTQSAYVRTQMGGHIREQSNGESAMFCFTSRIGDGGLYLLDEPENSLSPERQLELMQFLEDSARFYGCQFIIATHSPFLLAMRGARIYDLDADPVVRRKWTELPAVRTYFDFFASHADDFRGE